MTKTRWFVAGGAVAFGILAGVLATLLYIPRVGDSEPSANVVVSTEDIPAHSPLDPLIERGVFRVVSVPRYALIEDAIVRIEQLIGTTTTRPILKHEQLGAAWLEVTGEGSTAPALEAVAAIGTWYDAEGNPLPHDRPFVMAVYRGATHCDWGGFLFLETTWPLGEVVPKRSFGDTITFARTPGNPEAGLGFATSYLADTALPPDAYDTGYHRNGWRLWVADDRIQRAVWLVHGNAVERWPATNGPPACI
jgi:hypothetical protein